MTSQSDRDALEQARQSGIQEAITALRTFTGISGYTPAQPDPEHRSYVRYEEDLRDGRDVWAERLIRGRETVDRLTEQQEQARRVMEEEQQRRQAERVGSNVGGRVLGALKDVTFQEKRDHAAIGRQVDEAWQEVYRCESRVQEIETELAAVTGWVEQMFADVEATRSERQRRHDDDQLAREHAGRDVSPRQCVVYTPEEFVAADTRRLLRRESDHVVLDGSILSYKWRRDGDDDSYPDTGNWMLVWNPTTHETFLERAGHGVSPMVWLLGTKISSEKQALDVFLPLEARVRERNSLALVLDTYQAL